MNIESLAGRAESDIDDTEYKLVLTDLTPERIVRLENQLRWRLNQGCGECFYVIGISDDGTLTGLIRSEYDESIDNIRTIATGLNADVSVVEEKIVNDRIIGRLFIREIKHSNYTEIRIAVAGNVDGGKTTLCGVLSKGKLDDGRGSARASVFNYVHEIDSGRTSSIAQQIVGFDSAGNIIDAGSSKLKSLAWPDIVERSSKIVVFVDLAGHQHYLKTTMSGLNSCYPDYAMIVIGSNSGIHKETERFSDLSLEHIRLCLMLRIPFFIVLTKIDMCPVDKFKETVASVKRVAKQPGIDKIPYMVRESTDVFNACVNFSNGSILPIFAISNVSGAGLDLLKAFLNYLPAQKNPRKLGSTYTRLEIRETFSVTGTGTVVYGSLIGGEISVGDKIYIGPHFAGEDKPGRYDEVVVKGIRCKNVPLKKATAGYEITVALRSYPRSSVSRGMVLIDRDNANSFWAFDAQICISTANASITVKKGYQAVFYIGSIRQTCRIEKIYGDKESLGCNEKAKVRVKFTKKPEIIREGSRLTMREGRTRGYGCVENVVPIE